MQRTHDEAYPGPWRMRVTHLVADDRRDVALIYDLERTFVIEVPKRLLPCIGQWPPDRSTDPNLRAWLLHKGLLTTAESPDWSDRAGVEAPKITDISLDLSGACNMGCRYRFEKMTQSRIGRMGEGTLTAALDFVFTEAAGFDHIALHFGSGEPLIEIELLKRLVREAEARAAASGQRLTFELTTNATLVTPAIVTFLAEHPFNLRVSCDGPAEIHDRNRPRANGRASYSFVKRGLDLLLEHMPEQVTVNTVLCGNTPLRTIWAWAKDTGLRHFHVIKVGADLNAPETLPASELEEFRADLSGICDDMFADLTAGRRPIDFQPITKIIRRLMIPAPITRFCGVAGSYVGVASDGRLYPCLRHLGLKEYALGSCI